MPAIPSRPPVTSSAREAARPAAPLTPAHQRAAPARIERPLHGILLVTGAVFCFACSDAVAKSLMEVLPAVQVTWLRFVVFVLVMAPVALRMGGRSLRTRYPALQVLRGVGVSVSALLFILALGVVPLAEATAIAFVSPLFVTALSVPILGERAGARRWAAVAVGFLGVMIVVRPGSEAFDPSAILLILAALIWAASLVITRRMSGGDHPLVTMVYSAVVGCLVMSAVVPFAWADLGWRELGLGLATGLTATAAQCLIVLAYRQASASVLAPFFYSQLVWSALLGLLVFGNVPDLWTLVGTGIIIASGLYTAHRERLQSQRRA